MTLNRKKHWRSPAADGRRAQPAEAAATPACADAKPTVQAASGGGGRISPRAVNGRLTGENNQPEVAVAVHERSLYLDNYARVVHGTESKSNPGCCEDCKSGSSCFQGHERGRKRPGVPKQ